MINFAFNDGQLVRNQISKQFHSLFRSYAIPSMENRSPNMEHKRLIISVIESFSKGEYSGIVFLTSRSEYIQWVPIQITLLTRFKCVSMTYIQN